MRLQVFASFFIPVALLLAPLCRAQVAESPPKLTAPETSETAKDKAVPTPDVPTEACAVKTKGADAASASPDVGNADAPAAMPIAKYKLKVPRQYGGSLKRDRVTGTVNFTFYAVPPLESTLTISPPSNLGDENNGHLYFNLKAEKDSDNLVNFLTAQGAADNRDTQPIEVKNGKVALRSSLDFTLADTIERTIESNPPDIVNERFTITATPMLKLKGQIKHHQIDDPLVIQVDAFQ